MTWNIAEYKHCSYALRKAIQQAKCQYRVQSGVAIQRLRHEMHVAVSRAITDCKKKTSHVTDTDVLFSVADVSKTFKLVNLRKAAGPDSIPSQVLRADQLAGVITDIFNRSLSQSVVPTCLKMAAIVPLTKKAKITELNGYRPIALTSVIIKCLERLIKDHNTSNLPATLDPLQFA